MFTRSSAAWLRAAGSSWTTATSATGMRTMATGAGGRIKAPPMVYIAGEEMTHYVMNLINKEWLEPFIDNSAWEHYDMSCKNRDATKDQVLHDAVAAGSRVKAIFKEPTVTPSAIQAKEMGLSQAWGSPNGAMRRGWNGITISRDTIHVEGIKLGFSKPVLFERHAVGGEYAAGFKIVPAGKVKTLFTPKDGGADVVIDEREVKDSNNAVVTYDNPLDNVIDLAHHFYKRCLDAHVTPYVVTKKTVFKWQEGFWQNMHKVFEEHYKEKFLEAGLLDKCGGELVHLISDAATMQIIRWTDGGFGMAAHNYDGDMLTDQIAQVHRSPGFINSSLTGKAADGTMIREFEASHGTVADMWHAHLAGEETSLNPLGLVEALLGAMEHSCKLYGDKYDSDELLHFISALRHIVHRSMALNHGTRDLCGPSGLTTEGFIQHVAKYLGHAMDDSDSSDDETLEQLLMPPPPMDVDTEALQAMFESLDLDGNGSIDFDEFTKGLVRLGVQPRKYGF